MERDFSTPHFVCSVRENMVSEKNRLKQLAAMFSKQEISRGISSQDIKNRESELIRQGILPPREKKSIIVGEGKIFTPAGAGTRVEFERGSEPFRIETRKKVPEELRDIMLPSRFKITKSGELIRKRSFGPLSPQEQASERQKEALLRMTGRSQTQTTREEAFRQFQVAKKQRMMEVIVGLEGGRVTDPVAQRTLLDLSPEQRLNAREGLERLARRKGKASPLELSPSDVDFILRGAR